MFIHKDMDSIEIRKALRYNKISTAFLAVTVGALLYIVGLLVFPYNVVDVYNEPMPILNENKTIAKGDIIQFEIEYNKHIRVDGHSIKHIVCENGRLVTFAMTDTNLPVGYHKVISKSVRVPTDIKANQYCVLTLNTSFKVNFLREVHKSVETEPFYVVD